MFVARQEMEPPQVEALLGKFSELVTSLGGTVACQEYCGLRNLAYKIRNNRKGHYCLLHVEVSHQVLKEMERRMRLSEDVLRFMSVSVDAFDEGPCPLTVVRREKEEESEDLKAQSKGKEEGEKISEEVLHE